jgi:hypothetical protein
MANIQKNKTFGSIFGTMFSHGRFVKPKRDWMVLRIIFAALIIASIAFDAYMYREIVSGDMYISVKREELTIESLKTTDLQKIADSFERKKTSMTTLKIENLIDPSL